MKAIPGPGVAGIVKGRKLLVETGERRGVNISKNPSMRPYGQCVSLGDAR
jgi:hypothetical protein